MPVCQSPLKRLNLKILSHKLGMDMMQLQPTRTLYLLIPYNQYNK